MVLILIRILILIMLSSIQKTIRRLVDPWGSCKTHSDEENRALNAYLLELDHVKYTTAVSKPNKPTSM